MKYLFLLILFLPTGPLSQSDRWYAFDVEDTCERSYRGYKTGFKNSDGDITVPPIFGALTSVRWFDHIAAVSEQKGSRLETYFLLRDGSTKGRDSVLIYDMTLDCESEGFIRFVDPATGKTGLINRRGEVVIDALYALTRVNNGFVMALTEPEKEYWSGHGEHEGGCEHWSWTGKSEVLMDTTGRIVVDNFDTDNGRAYLYSLDVHDIRPDDDPYRTVYNGTDGKFYSVMNLDKYFSEHFFPSFLSDLSKLGLARTAFELGFYYNGTDTGWETVTGELLIERYYEGMKLHLEEFKEIPGKFYISREAHPFFTERWKELYPWLFDGNGQLMDRYPVYSIHIDRECGQDHYTFIDKGEGFKLLSVSLSDR